MSDLNIEIVTPDGVIFSGTAQSCTTPGAEGQFQVLKDHAALLAVLEVGEIRLVNTGGKKSLATSGGYVEVKNNIVNIVVESAELAEQIDAERAKSAKERAKDRMLKKGEIDVQRVEFALARALNRLKISSQI
jgi:F-type H+-transporting ATPase subunit epsilon